MKEPLNTDEPGYSTYEPEGYPNWGEEDMPVGRRGTEITIDHVPAYPDDAFTKSLRNLMEDATMSRVSDQDLCDYDRLLRGRLKQAGYVIAPRPTLDQYYIKSGKWLRVLEILGILRKVK